MRALRVLAAFVVGAIGDPAAALAQVELEWRAPSGCMSEELAHDAVAQRIGRDPFVASGGQLRIVVSADGDALLRFRLSDAHGEPIGERVIQSTADCRAIDREIAVVLSLLVEVGQSEIELVIPAPIEEERPRRARARAPTAVPVLLVLGARAAAAAGLVADASIGAEVFAGVQVAGYEVRIEAFGARGDSLASGSPGISSLAFGAALRGCVPLIAERSEAGQPVGVGVCAALGAGAIRARGKNLALAREVDAPFVTAAAGARLTIALATFAAIEIELDGIVPLSRAIFVYDAGGGLAFEPWPVAPSLSVGLRLSLET